MNLTMIVGQKSTASFVVNDVNGNPIPQSLLTLTCQNSDNTVVGVSINQALGNFAQVTALKAGSAQLDWQFALDPGAPFTGSFNVCGPDTITVENTPVNPTVTDSYSTPQ